MDKEWNEKYNQQDLQRLRGLCLMYDFSCTDPDDITYEVLAERVRYRR